MIPTKKTMKKTTINCQLSATTVVLFNVILLVVCFGSPVCRTLRLVCPGCAADVPLCQCCDQAQRLLGRLLKEVTLLLKHTSFSNRSLATPLRLLSQVLQRSHALLQRGKGGLTMVSKR
jgi:hypothetical protein